MESTAIDQTRGNESWVLASTVLASAMAFIDATALNVALPSIQSEAHASGTQILWVVNSYALVAAALIFFGGALGDRLGRARIFAAGIALFVAASLGCGFAWSIESLIAARTLQGLGAALMIPGSLSLISTTFDASRRGRAIGIWSACSVIMTALGPIIGGLLADIGWWRAVFFINLPTGALSLVILLSKVSLSDERSRSGRLDYRGAILSTLTLASLNLALIEVASRGWHDPLVVIAMLVSIVSGVTFLWNESRATNPLLPLTLFRDRTFTAACQLTLCLYSAFYAMLLFLALNLIQIQGYQASTAGLAQLPVMLLVVLVSPVAGSLVDRRGSRLPLTIGGIMASLGFLWLARVGLTSGPSGYWAEFLPPLVVLGFAMGMTAAPLSTTIINSVPQSQIGIASGVNSTLSRLSSVLGIAVLGPLAILTFSQSLLAQSAEYSPSGEQWIALQRESQRFADATPPPGMSPDLTAAVEHAIRVAFVDAFRVVSLTCAAVVGASTLIAAVMLKRPAAD